jgi:ornithine cyclodeaminase/alanine dehydrogenase-like protein (mu-crystallin family)
MDHMLEAIESMLGHFGRGEASNLTRRKINASGGTLSVMAGGLFYDGVMGVKTYTIIKGKYSFQVSLYDTDTGKLLCYTQANRLGHLRTGATTGIAVKHLSNPDSAIVGIIGTGNQAPTQLEAVCKVRNIKQIKAFSRTKEGRDAFAHSMTEKMGIEVISASTNQEAVSGCDIVICIANTMEPVVAGEWLSPGSTLIAAGPTSWRAKEVDDATFERASKIFVDSPEQATIEVGDMASAADRGAFQWSRLQELRHVVGGETPGRDTADQIIFAKLMGTGVADVASAKLAYDRAKAAGIGLEMEW